MGSALEGLRTRLLIALLAAGALPVVLLTAATILEYRADAARLNEALGAESQATARSAADYLGFLINRTRSALNRVSVAANEGRLTNRLLEVERAELPFLAGLFVTDHRGIVRFGTPAEIGTDLSAGPGFADVRAGKIKLYTSTFRSLFAPEDVLAVAIRRASGSAFAGIVGSRIRVEHVNDLLQNYSPGNLRDATYVLDRDGKILAAAGAGEIKPGMAVPDHPLLVKARTARSGWLNYTGPILGTPRVGGFTSLPELGWTVVSARDEGSRLKDLRTTLLWQMAIVAVTALFIGALAFALSRRLSRPLEDLAGAMRQVREVDLQAHPVPIMPTTGVESDIREVADLVETYNLLVAALNRRFVEVAAFEKLQELNNALQYRNEEIQAQSEELQVQNEEIQSQAEELQSQNDEILRQNGLIVEHSERLALQNRELERLTGEALRANHHKSQFLASMSHELRTPLNSIIGYSELILGTAGPDFDQVARENIEVILRNGRHLLGLITDVLDIARIEAGKIGVCASRFDTRLILADIVNSSQMLAAEKDLALLADLSTEVGVAETDETRLRQIVLNLLSNAIKFTRKGEIRVTLRPMGPDRFEIRVNDTGIGIAPDQQEAVFEEFRQVADPETKVTEGVGLGLSISRKLARLLGGDLSVESTLGQGSTFRLDLPLKLPAPVPQEAEA